MSQGSTRRNFSAACSSSSRQARPAAVDPPGAWIHPAGRLKDRHGRYVDRNGTRLGNRIGKPWPCSRINDRRIADRIPGHPRTLAGSLATPRPYLTQVPTIGRQGPTVGPLGPRICMARARTRGAHVAVRLQRITGGPARSPGGPQANDRACARARSRRAKHAHDRPGGCLRASLCVNTYTSVFVL